MPEQPPQRDQGGRPQRQDSLEDQMRDVMIVAVRMGCYDAHDWLVRNFRTHAQRVAASADCPGGHGEACCGFPAACRAAIAEEPGSSSVSPNSPFGI